MSCTAQRSDGFLQGRVNCSTCMSGLSNKSCCVAQRLERALRTGAGCWISLRHADAKNLTSWEASQVTHYGVHAHVQETEGSHVAVRPERRRQAIEELVAAGPQALQVLAACLTQDGGHGQAAA